MKTSERHWVRVTTIDSLPPREGRAVRIGGRELAIFNLGDQVLATDNRCPHKGGPLCDGIVTGRAVVCPLHAWKVNLETGQVDRPSAGRDHCVHTYPTLIEDGIVIIGLPANAGIEREAAPATCAAEGQGGLVASPEGKEGRAA